MNKVVYILGLLVSLNTYAWNVSLGLYKPDPKVQDSNGNEKADQYSPYLNIGWHIPVKVSWFPDFVPRLGYIYNKNNSGDYYSQYKVETYNVLYDFYYQPKGWRDISLRYGFGSFIQKISGDSRAVTIPNGSSTSTAYGPGSSKSATMSFNIGVDYRMNKSGSGYLKDYGISFQSFYFDPGGRSSFLAYQMGITGYF
jgi:hypothetical protein